MSIFSISRKNKKEVIYMLSFYLLVALSSIINLGMMGILAFLVILFLCAKHSPRLSAIILLSMFYLPTGGLQIPSVFIIVSFIVVIFNFSRFLKSFHNPITLWILKLYSVFFVIRLLSVINAINMDYFWNYIFVSFSVLIHLLVFSCLFDNQEDLQVTLRWWGVIGAMSSILGYIHFTFSDSVFLRQIYTVDVLYDKATIEGTKGLVRWIWAGVDPNFTGLGLLIPFAINVGALFKKLSLFNIILAAISLLGILGTYSRTSFLIAMIIVALFVIISKSKYKYVAIALIPISFIMVITYFPEFVDRIDSIQAAATQGQGSGRYPLYMESIENFFKHPIFGIGAGQTAVISKYHLEAHNLFLQTLGEIGLLGFLCIVFIFIKSFSQAWSIRRFEPTFLIALFAVFLNCNTVSAFDMRIILSYVIIISYYYCFKKEKNKRYGKYSYNSI